MKMGRKLPLKDAWFILFILGVVMLNYPFLHIFNKDVLIFGIPLILLYFFIGWPFSVFVVYLFSTYLGRHSNQEDVENNLPAKPPGGST